MIDGEVDAPSCRTQGSHVRFLVSPEFSLTGFNDHARKGSVFREVLRTLELSGLAHIKPVVDGGVFVKKPDAATFAGFFSNVLGLGSIDIEDLTVTRLPIEKGVVYPVVKKARIEDFKSIDESVGSAFAKIERGEKIRNEKFRFHVLLVELSRNSIFLMIANAIVPIIAAFVEMLNPSLEHTRRIPENHPDNLEGIKRRNVLSAK